MKKIITLLVLVVVNSIGFAQYDTAPQKTSYQAIIRNGNNELVKNTTVSLKLSLLSGTILGNAVYVETHSTQTNENGLLVIQIGGGQAVFGTYTNGIYWGMPYFLKTEIDLLGGTNYTITSTSELLSVPVSNYSHVSGSLHGPSWDFVGTYNQTNQANTDFEIIGFSYITYLGVDKVMWTFTTYDEVIIDGVSKKTRTLSTLYGNVFSNVVTFKSQDIGNGENTPELIGTLIDKKLTITYGSPEGEVLELVKE
jgi:hypothetical protein